MILLFVRVVQRTCLLGLALGTRPTHQRQLLRLLLLPRLLHLSSPCCRSSVCRDQKRTTRLKTLQKLKNKRWLRASVNGKAKGIRVYRSLRRGLTTVEFFSLPGSVSSLGPLLRPILDERPRFNDANRQESENVLPVCHRASI